MSISSDARTAQTGGVDNSSRVGRRRLTVAQALVSYLSVQYSERDGERRRLIPGVFGIFGHGNVVGLGEALEECGHDLPYYQGKNEQAMVHAAAGYAKATLRCATLACAGSVGPGATNMVTGAATATANRLPVLLLPADVFMHRRQDPVLQQIENPMLRDSTANDAFKAVSRYFDRITRPEQLLDSLPAAMRVLCDPAETGAVTIALPQDVQGEAHDYPEEFFAPRTWQIARRPAPADEIQAAVDLLRIARRPLIVAGGGVRYSGAEAEVSDFARTFGIPVAETHAGKGCGPSSPMGVGVLGVNGTSAANRLAKDADVVVAIGTRLQDFTTGSHALFQHRGARLISINVSAHDAYKMGSMPVVGDAATVTGQLHSALAKAGVVANTEYGEEVQQLTSEWRAALDLDLAPRQDELMSQAQVIRALNELTSDGDVVVTAAGTPPADVSRLWDTSDGSECHIEFGFSCMGHEIPAGIGYRMGRSASAGEVFVVIGDGTYLMNNTELVTAVQEGLSLTVVLIVNGGFQAIRGLQLAKTGVSFGNEFRYRNATSGRLDGDVVQVDYAANARSMGCVTFEVRTLQEFEQAIHEARATPGPKVVVTHVEPRRLMAGAECFWDVGVAQASQLERVRERSEEHLRATEARRYMPHS